MLVTHWQLSLNNMLWMWMDNNQSVRWFISDNEVHIYFAYELRERRREDADVALTSNHVRKNQT